MWSLHAWEMRTLNWIKLVLGRCVGLQYPVVGCDNVNMGAFTRGKMQWCYKYPPTPLSAAGSNVHRPWALFQRLAYYINLKNNYLMTLHWVIISKSDFLRSYVAYESQYVKMRKLVVHTHHVSTLNNHWYCNWSSLTNPMTWWSKP